MWVWTGYVVLGSNGEFTYLSVDERVEIVKRVRQMTDAASRHQLVIAGAGCECKQQQQQQQLLSPQHTCLITSSRGTQTVIVQKLGDRFLARGVSRLCYEHDVRLTLAVRLQCWLIVIT